jgi:flagellar hook-associated protein 2
MSTSGINLSSLLSAFGSSQGINVQAAVAQALAADEAPEFQWEAEQQTLQTETTDLNSIEGDVTNLENTLTALSGPTSAMSAVTTASSNSSVVTATAVNGAAPENHTVVVNNVAATASWYSAEVASPTTDLTPGSLTITVGSGTPTQITVGSGVNTLTDLANDINGLNLGVTASVVTDSSGSLLSIVANNSGAASNFTITNDSTVGFTQATTGQDASLTVDGIPVDSASNTVTGVVNGVTFNLVSASPGTPVSVSIQPDTNSATTAITNFVNAYNTVMGDVNTQYAVGANNMEGPLAGDSTLSLLQSDLLTAGGYTNGSSSGIATLADLGITMNDDGTLSLNTATLDSAIQNNYSAVQAFMQGTSSNGFVNFLDSQMTALTDPTNGAFTVDLQSISNENTDLQNQINNFQPYLQEQQQILTAEYNQADIALQELPTEEAQLNAELGYQPSSSTTPIL